MNDYPMVLGELETLQAVVAGRSLARYGDGEFKMASHGVGIKSQRGDLVLSERLKQILESSGDCLVGIPNIHSATPKAVFWHKHLRYSQLLVDRPYVSAFITRPDSAPWIDTLEYWALLEQLWRGQDVTLVRGSGKSFTGDLLLAAGARTVTEILAPRQHAWADYPSLLDRVGIPKRALLCLGPTATVMAVDLCAKGVHAIDLGHIGMFWKKKQHGHPMVVTEADRTPEVVA